MRGRSSLLRSYEGRVILQPIVSPLSPHFEGQAMPLESAITEFVCGILNDHI